MVLSRDVAAYELAPGVAGIQVMVCYDYFIAYGCYKQVLL